MDSAHVPAMPPGLDLRVDIARLQLLERSVDWYWALDAQLRLSALESSQKRGHAFGKDVILAKAPWDWPGTMPANAQALRAKLECRDALDRFELALRDRRGHWRHFSVLGEPVYGPAGEFDGYRGTARETTARRRAEALLKLEHSVTRELAEAATSRQVLQSVMRVICESEQWETGGFFRVLDDSGALTLEAGWSGPGMARAAVDYYKDTAGRVVPPGGMLSQVVASRKPRWVRALRASQTTWSERVRSTGERATFFAPVLVDGRVIGVFAFASRQRRAPDERLLRSMRVIGEQAGQFLKRKSAEQELRSSEARFRALTDLSSDWYWETDADLRVTRLEGRRVEESATFPGRGAIGKPLSLADLVYETAAHGRVHRDAIEAQRSFHDVVLMHVGADGERRLESVSGEPIDDGAGRFAGYRGVGRDITAVRQAEQSRLEAVRLQAENQALEEGNRLKALFLTNMSHELRTPLNGVNGFVQLLALHAAKANDAKASDYLKKIDTASQHLLRLIEQLLTFAQMEARKIEFRSEPALLSSLIKEVEATLAEAMRRKSLAVTHHFEPSVDAVFLDPLRTKQVIEAYLSNAVKFTPAGGRVRLRTSAADDGCFRLEVEDSGIGIAQADLPKLFAAFHQLSAGLTKAYGGAGIGLAIARTLVEAQGGTVGVESTPGVGSTFHFVLPRYARADPGLN